MNIIRDNRKGLILFSTILFLIIFNPPFHKKISFTIFFSFLSSVYLLTNYRHAIKTIKKLKKPFTILFIAYAYFLIISVINAVRRESFSQIIIIGYLRSILSIISHLSISLFIVIFARKKGYTTRDLTKCFIAVGVAQGIIGVICFLSPTIKASLNSLMIRNSDNEAFAAIVNANSYRRNYGFASTLFDIFGFTMSLLSVMAFERAYVDKQKRYYLFFAVISFVAILNARTSIVLISIGIIITILYVGLKQSTVQDLLRRIIVIILITAMVAFVMQRISRSSTSTAEWLMEGIHEIVTFLQGKETGIFALICGDFVFFPDSAFDTVFGTALSPMQLVNKNTDMGYIQNIWEYGIIGSLINYTFWISLANTALKRTNRRAFCDKMTIICWTVLLFIYQIKLNTWGYSMAGAVIYPVLMSIATRDELDIFVEETFA